MQNKNKNVIPIGLSLYITFGKWDKPKIHFTVTRGLRICLGFIAINIGFYDLEAWYKKVIKFYKSSEAENEKLSELNGRLVNNNINLRAELSQARKEERAKIIEICKYALMEIVACDQQLRLEPESIYNPNKRNEAVNTALTATCERYNLPLQPQDLLPIGNELANKIVEVLKSAHVLIEPQQPKSCEGCEHNSKEYECIICNNIEHKKRGEE